MQLNNGNLVIERSAPKRSVGNLPFHVWMALAKGVPSRLDEAVQAVMGGRQPDENISELPPPLGV